MNALRILIADDHEIVRQGLRLLIDAVPNWTICGEAKSGAEAVEMATELQPDVVVLDHEMPSLNGIDATRRIKEQAPDAEVIIFSGTDDESFVHQVFAAGGRSYIPKTEAGRHLVAAIATVSQHKPYFTDKLSESVLSRYLQRDHFETPGAERHDRLTRREREIVQLIGEGKTNKEIGAALSISTRTAETHRSTVMRKLQLRSTADVVRYAIRNNIIQA